MMDERFATRMGEVMIRSASTMGLVLSRWVGLACLPAALSVLFVAAAGAQAPARMDVLIGFDRPPGLAEENLVRSFGGGIKYRYQLVPAIAANIPETSLSGLLRNPRVVTVELDGEVHAIDAELDATWGVKRIGAGTVHAGGNRGEGVLVAVIDSGIHCGHPDLVANCVGGWNFVTDNSDFFDDNGHGTHVAGTVAAAADAIGVVGAAPMAGLIALKVLNASGSGQFSDIIAALDWIVSYNSVHAVQILVTNNSYGSSSNPGSIVEEAFIRSTGAGILHVAAAGNSGNPGGKGDNVGYPARYASVVAVAATGQNDGRASFSSTGPAVELAAPGVSINSTLASGGYGTKSGTSMASPHVAGVAALVISSGHATSPAQVRDRMRVTAIDLGNAGRDSHYGYGLVDAIGAVADPATGGLPPEESVDNGIVLGATGYKVKGLQKADLSWAGASSDAVALFRDGELIATPENDGSYTDEIDAKGGGSYSYQLCELGGTSDACSGLVTVSF